MSARMVSVCCEAGPVDEITDGAGRCSRCGDNTTFVPDTWTQDETQVHTPGPWHVADYQAEMQQVRSATALIAYISDIVSPGAPANARRIVAAVNACEDIATKALEAGVVAEMLAVLGSLTDPEGHIWHGGNDECTGECREVRAVIAQAKSTS